MNKKIFAPNLLSRNFVIDALVDNITYISTKEGWLYRAIVKDLFTKKIVGYAILILILFAMP